MSSYRIKAVDDHQDPLRGPGGQLVKWLGNPLDEGKMDRVREGTLFAAMLGQGIEIDSIKEPARQRSIFDCTRYAFINGMAAAYGGRLMIDSGAFEAEIAKARREESSLDITFVAKALVANGVIEEIKTLRNPLLAAEALAKGLSFLVYIDNCYRPPHALAMVPLSNPTENRYAARIDSLSGNISPIGVEDFIQINLEFIWRYPYASVFRLCN